MLFNWFKAPVDREVPGYGRWVFRRGSDWAEIDDYLGAFELTAGELHDWITLFEGRREWASAIGSVFMTIVTPVKAQIMSQEMYPALRRHRGNNIGAQVRKALAASSARDDVLFANDDFEAALAAHRDVFYDSDHHPCAYGVWLIYDRLNRRLAELFPERIGEAIPWYGNPPDNVREGQAPGCWPDHTGLMSDARNPVRLEVSVPGETVGDSALGNNQRRYPYRSLVAKRENGDLSILMAHDSYMRFPLASWTRKMEDVHLPFATGVGLVQMQFFRRYTQGFLETAITDSVPDVFIEQFPECRLTGTARRYIDGNIRAAAAFGRAEEPRPGCLPQAGEHIVARVVFEDVKAEKGVNPVAILSIGGRDVARQGIMPGVRRAVFFGPVECDLEDGADAMPKVELSKGTASATNLTWRIAPLVQ